VGAHTNRIQAISICIGSSPFTKAYTSDQGDSISWQSLIKSSLKSILEEVLQHRADSFVEWNGEITGKKPRMKYVEKRWPMRCEGTLSKQS
jgi:hypothetical protein